MSIRSPKIGPGATIPYVPCTAGDTDNDGVPDATDSCPHDPEDLDGYQDGDGCPEPDVPDSDGDGILNPDDGCPDDPEDLDGFQDTDGCPDPDNDGDGVPDVTDGCPDSPEDVDGFADADGWVRFKTVYPSWYGGRTPHIHFKVLIDSREVVAGQAFFDDEVNAEIFGNWDPYREHASKRRAFNRNDPFIDANHDGNVDGVYCQVDRLDRTGVVAKAVLTVDTA